MKIKHSIVYVEFTVFNKSLFSIIDYATKISKHVTVLLQNIAYFSLLEKVNVLAKWQGVSFFVLKTNIHDCFSQISYDIGSYDAIVTNDVSLLLKVPEKITIFRPCGPDTDLIEETVPLCAQIEAFKINGIQESIIFSTSNYCAIFTNSNFRKFEEGRGKYFGITFIDDKIAIFARCENTEEESCILLYDKELEYQGKLDLDIKLEHVHQILYLNTKLIIVNTKLDRIDICHRTGKQIKSIGVKEFALSKNPHINSINCINGTYYCICHCKGESSKVLLFDHGFNFLDRFAIGTHAHDIFIDPQTKQKMILLSKNRTIYNLETNKSYKIGLGYSRGAARSKNYCYVGDAYSMDRKNERDNRYDGRINVLNDNYEIIGSVIIPESGQIFSIRMLNTKDYAHSCKELKL